MSQFQKNNTFKYITTPVNNWRLRLYAPPHRNAETNASGVAKEPNLYISIKKDQPVFVVTTNVTNDRNNGKIEAAVSWPEFFAILSAINDYGMRVKDAKEGEKISAMKWEIKNTMYIASKKTFSTEPMHIANLVVGQNEDGEIYIALLSTLDERPKIKFTFAFSKNAQYVENGERASKSRISSLFTIGYTNMIQEVLTGYYISMSKSSEDGESDTVQPANNSYGNNSNKQSNYQQRPQQQQQQPKPAPSAPDDSEFNFDADIPF